MSNKAGMPWMKLNNKSYSHDNEHHGNNMAVFNEALEERWSNDENLDRTKTKDNIYMTGYRSGFKLLNDIDKEMAILSANLKRQGKRGIKENAITSFAGIIKPSEEYMNTLTPKQQIQILIDSWEVINEKFGTNPVTGIPNIRAGVIQVDEGVPHLHYFGVPYTADGRLSAKEIFTPKLSRWLNEEFPKIMNSRYGWNLELCKDPKAYDPDKAKTMNEQELEDYKKQCYEHRKAKKKQHGRTSKQYKFDKELEKQREALQKSYEAKEQKLETRELALQNKEAEFDKQVNEQVLQIKRYKKSLVDKKRQLDDKESELETRNASVSSLEAHTELLNRQAIEALQEATELKNKAYRAFNEVSKNSFDKYRAGWMKNHKLQNSSISLQQQCFNDYCDAYGLNDSDNMQQQYDNGLTL